MSHFLSLDHDPSEVRPLNPGEVYTKAVKEFKNHFKVQTVQQFKEALKEGNYKTFSFVRHPFDRLGDLKFLSFRVLDL